MSKIEFSSKGVSELRNLQSNLMIIGVDISDYATALSTGGYAVSGGLGEFSTQIIDYVQNVQSISKEASQCIAELANYVGQFAGEMEQTLSFIV